MEVLNAVLKGDVSLLARLLSEEDGYRHGSLIRGNSTPSIATTKPTAATKFIGGDAHTGSLPALQPLPAKALHNVNYATVEEGRTALHFAASTGNIQCLDLLLRQPNINVNAQDFSGNTALHLAAACSEANCVQLLLTAGANPFIKNLQGYRPIDYAKEGDCEQILYEHMAAVNMVTYDQNMSIPLAQLEDDLPQDAGTLKQFALELIISHRIFQDRCKQALGISDEESSERFIDHLQYWQDENERQAATINYLKIRIQMLEQAALQQEEYYRENLADLTKQHMEQLQAIFRRNEETEKAFVAYQKKHAEDMAELNRLRSEISSIGRKKESHSKADSHSHQEIQELQNENEALRAELAKVQAEKVTLGERLKLNEKLKSMLEKENTELRNDFNQMRQSTQHAGILKQIEDAQTEHEDKDELNGTIIFTKGESGPKRVKAATCEKLVQRLMDPNIYDHQYLQGFILSHKLFIDSKVLLATLTSAYRQNGGEGKQVEYAPSQQNRIINILKYWVDNYWSDFEDDPALMQQLTSFAESTGDEKLNNVMKIAVSRKMNKEPPWTLGRDTRQPPKPILPKALTKRYSSDASANRGSNNTLSDDKGSTSSGTSSRDRPTSVSQWSFGKLRLPDSVNEETRFKLSEVDPLEVARQLTLIEFELFGAIKPREFLDLGWMKPDKEIRAPNIMRMTRWSNHVVKWLISEIVLIKESTKMRAAVFEKIIMIAQQLEKLNNLNGAKEVLAALQSSSVYRLKKTKEAVGSKYLRILGDLVKLTSSELNYKNLRARVSNAEPPLIPFPGVYQGDLVFIDTCAKSRLDGGLINFSKIEKEANCILQLQTYQQAPYVLEAIVEIQDYIKNFAVLDDDQAYNHSLICEPRT
ncbi:hypothetical protein HK102_007086 [Quaeritorhiza haematococci]|nr:hypothetical protein HK102_007086 [Quaeritorhiza haematococci]